MNKPGNIIWDIPFYFFIFLGLFISIKFIFIFFFRAAFEPQFIFELTPFYIFSGVSSLQLLFLSLIVVGYDTYLHIKPTRKNILRSFIPTTLMLCGLGLGITTKEISFSYLANYLLFGLLLFIIIVDHRRTLVFPEMLPPKAPPKPLPLLSRMKLPFFTKSKPQKASPTTKSRFSFSAVSSIFSIFKRGKKSAGVSGKGRESAAEHKTSPSKAQQKEVLAEKSMGEEKSEVTTPPQEIVPEEPSHTVEGQSGGMGGDVSGSPQDSGAAIPQTTPEKAGTIPYYKDQIPPGTKPKLSPSIITSIFGKRKKTREPERRTTIPFKPQAESSQKEDQKEKVSLGDDESLPVFEENPPDKGDSVQELKKEAGEAIFPIVAESTKDKESEKQKIIEEEVKESIVTKHDLEAKREELKGRHKEIEDKITIFKDLQTNYKNIQSGLDSLKNELENICKDIRLTEQDSKLIEKKSDRRDLERDMEEKILVSPYLIAPEKIPKPSLYSKKWKMAEKRKRDIRRAKTILNGLEGKIEKLEKIYIK